MKPSLAFDSDPEAYANAMMACHGYAPACSDAGECLHDGDCFSSSGLGFKSARKRISDLIEDAPDVYARSWLRLALDALDHHQFMMRGALDALKVVAINKAVREQYGIVSHKD